MKNIFLLITGLILISQLSVLSAQDTGSNDPEPLQQEAIEDTKEEQVDKLFAAWDKPKFPGAAVSIVKDGEIVYSKGFGMANLEYDIPITPSTVFHIASVSKQFTTFAILLLERDGKLQLDDDVRKYIPEVPDFGKTITLRHLAHHTSGLRDQWSLLSLAGWRMDDVITRDQILKLISHQKELNFDPGEEYLYCNTGFTLLAEVVARVSGQSFAKFTEERIFKPLNMSSTLFYDDHERIVKNRAYSYYPVYGRYKKSVLNYANVGATSLFTTVEDLSLWALNFEDPEVGDTAMVRKMKTRGILNNGDPVYYGLGQSLFIYKGLKAVGHGGGDAGYRTYIGRFPEQRFSVIVFSNNAMFNPNGQAMKIVDIYLKDELIAEEPEEKEAEKDGAEVMDAPRMAAFDAESVNLSEFSGTFYSEELHTTYEFVLEDGKLVAKHRRLDDIKLSPAKEDMFTGDAWFFSQLDFVRDETNAISGCKVSSGRVRNLQFQKME